MGFIGMTEVMPFYKTAAHQLSERKVDIHLPYHR
jgi:hypothetical protein